MAETPWLLCRLPLFNCFPRKAEITEYWWVIIIVSCFPDSGCSLFQCFKSKTGTSPLQQQIEVSIPLVDIHLKRVDCFARRLGNILFKYFIELLFSTVIMAFCSMSTSSERWVAPFFIIWVAFTNAMNIS
jgi:hypothetical protein